MFTDDAFGLAAGSSPLRRVLDQVDQVAHDQSGVLVRGEPGTGRGIVARAVHARSGVVGAPFVAVYCGSVGGVDLETRLFGGPKPSESRPQPTDPCERIFPGSALHEAMGGTLYFRNIEELSLRAQGRLARLLRDRECLVGSRGQAVPYDVRPMAAVDPDVETLAEDGRLRADFYRRFSQNQISVPPLRECREEISGLAGFLLGKACEKLGIPAKSIDPAAISVLAAMPWRGNARELMGLIETLAVKVADETITLDALLTSVRLEAGSQIHWNLGSSLREARQHFEREYIAAVVAQHHGRVPAAARSLGIQRTNLYRKLRHLQIAPQREGQSLRPQTANH